MKKSNNDLRRLARGLGVPLWAVAEAENIGEQTLYRNWRRELSPDEKARISEVIKKLAKESGVQ